MPSNVRRRKLYVVWSKDRNAHKVGVSVDPQKRCNTFHGDCTLVYETELIDFAFAIEARVHVALAPYSLGNEWFEVNQTQAISAILTAMMNPVKIPKRGRGRPAKADREKYKQRMVRVRDIDFEVISIKAERANLSFSEYMRQSALNA